MAVYTEISRDSVVKWLSENYSLPPLATYEPISEGIENTNYLLTLDRKPKWVLTLFEVWESPMVANYAELCRHLSEQDLPVPAPQRSVKGDLVVQFGSKPAVLVPFFEGRANMSPTSAHCQIMGRLVAQLHEAAAGFELDWQNPRGIVWWERALEELEDKIPPGQHAKLREEAIFLIKHYPQAVPQGVCHCDLFKNNVLWKDSSNVSAVIDFYFGGRDALIFDLAVCANDWCVKDAGEHDDELLAALLDGYQSVRKLETKERLGFEIVVRAAALRFWLSRLHDIHYPRAAKILTPHDPRQFEEIHRSCLSNAHSIRKAVCG